MVKYKKDIPQTGKQVPQNLIQKTSKKIKGTLLKKLNFDTQPNRQYLVRHS